MNWKKILYKYLLNYNHFIAIIVLSKLSLNIVQSQIKIAIKNYSIMSNLSLK